VVGVSSTPSCAYRLAGGYSCISPTTTLYTYRIITKIITSQTFFIISTPLIFRLSRKLYISYSAIQSVPVNGCLQKLNKVSLYEVKLLLDKKMSKKTKNYTKWAFFRHLCWLNFAG